ncbi:MAG: electron transport complex subunit E, partial [Oscillospiraceae bacterium]|nr:electron transport complex subunit E [Oscillospiraceae bacterium]
MGSIREIFGAGSWMGIQFGIETPVSIFIMPAGGFFVLGIVIAVVNKLAKKKPPKELHCAGCPNEELCEKYRCDKEAKAS